MSGEAVPVVDAGAPGAAGAGGAGVAALRSACREWGFFQVVNHGIGQHLTDEVWRVTRAFFALPQPVKDALARDEHNARGYYNRELTKNRRDMKEVFDFGPPPAPEWPDDHPVNRTEDGYNRWPAAALCPDLRETLLAWCAACEHLAMRLLATVAASLDVPADALLQGFVNHSSFARLNHYPVSDPLTPDGSARAAASGHMGVHHHSDAGALTLLLQDEVGGLEVLRGETWFPVTPMAGAIVINIGDIVQVWSNDRYRAPLHRVVASGTRDRYSIPYFFNPSYATDYAPLAVPGDAPRFRGINWGHFRRQRQLGDYADYGHEIQIDDFRL